ncbi:MAG: sigma-70 family RNA polymerase sigma factor [Phycisphaerales bacterium]|nr:sigma-70 family RNA polymerase sigma factor [Phycisphaerales bacterium]
MCEQVDASAIAELTCFDTTAGEPLAQFVARKYAELRRLAHTLGNHAGTSLVHTAYRRLAESSCTVEGEGQGFSLFSMAMRHALIDRLRAAEAQKRGGNAVLVSYDPGRDDPLDHRPRFDLLALDEAIVKLRTLDARKWEVVEHKWFGGLTDDQTASALGLSRATIERDWRFAKAWLREQLAVA